MIEFISEGAELRQYSSNRLIHQCIVLRLQLGKRTLKHAFGFVAFFVQNTRVPAKRSRSLYARPYARSFGASGWLEYADHFEKKISQFMQRLKQNGQALSLEFLILIDRKSTRLNSSHS